MCGRRLTARRSLTQQKKKRNFLERKVSHNLLAINAFHTRMCGRRLSQRRNLTLKHSNIMIGCTALRNFLERNAFHTLKCGRRLTQRRSLTLKHSDMMIGCTAQKEKLLENRRRLLRQTCGCKLNSTRSPLHSHQRDRVPLQSRSLH